MLKSMENVSNVCDLAFARSDAARLGKRLAFGRRPLLEIPGN